MSTAAAAGVQIVGKQILLPEMTEQEMEIRIPELRKKIQETDAAIAALTLKATFLQRINDRESVFLEEFDTIIENKRLQVQTHIDKVVETKQEKRAEIEKLQEETATLKSEVAEAEEDLNEHVRFKTFLVWLSSLDLDLLEVQKAETQKGLEEGLKSSPEGVLTSRSMQSSSQRHTLVENPTSDDSQEIPLTSPSQVVDTMSKLKDQIVSLSRNKTEAAGALDQSVETARRQVTKEEEELMLQVNEVKDRVSKEKVRADMFREKVQLHDASKTQEDETWEAVIQKVAEVHSECLESQQTRLSPLDQLCAVELRVLTLNQQTERIPKETYQKLMKIKKKERRSRMREEKVRLQREKEIEKMNKYKERADGESKKTVGRKLISRSLPVKKKSQVSHERTTRIEENHPHLFTDDAD